MNRRGFLGAIAAFAATAVIDPEKLLWVSGKKLISIPKPSLPEPELWNRPFVFLTRQMTLAEFRAAYPGHELLDRLVHYDPESPMQAMLESGRIDGRLRLVEWWLDTPPGHVIHF